MQFNRYTSFDLSTQPIMNLKIKSLVLDLIHNRDVVDQLKKARVRDLTDWMWQKQLRYYLDEKTQLTLIKMSNASFDYTYEYQVSESERRKRTKEANGRGKGKS